MLNKCPKKTDDKKAEDKVQKEKEENAAETAQESGLITSVLSAVKGKGKSNSLKAAYIATANVIRSSLDFKNSEDECRVQLWLRRMYHHFWMSSTKKLHIQ